MSKLADKSAALRRWAPLTRGPPHFPRPAGADSADSAQKLNVRFSADPAHTGPPPPATSAAAAAAHLTAVRGHWCIYLSQSHHVHTSARGAVLTWVRRELLVSQICRQPFIEGNALQGWQKKKNLQVCLW